MRKRLVSLSLVLVTLVVVIGISIVGVGNQSSLASLACSGDRGIVDKSPNEVFTVKVTLKNTGGSEGTWSVNSAFEGEKWTWTGTPQNLTLKPGNTKTLTWNGSVPDAAPTDSVARLIIYYDDSFAPLNWWIHVVPSAELTITSSTVQ